MGPITMTANDAAETVRDWMACAIIFFAPLLCTSLGDMMQEQEQKTHSALEGKEVGFCGLCVASVAFSIVAWEILISHLQRGDELDVWVDLFSPNLLFLNSCA